MKRVTIVIDEDNEKMIRLVQSRKIKQSNTAYSFSRAVNDVLRGKAN